MKLYKYYSLATKEQRQYIEKAIVQREIFCGNPATFNDPFDCNIAIHLKVYLKKHGVACFSGENADHVLMFSHYGDRHRGIALVFDVVSDGPGENLSFLGRGRWVEYVDHNKLPDLLKSQGSDRAHEVLFTKWNKWVYEKEYRVLADLEECDSSPVRHYEQGELVEVIFGLGTTDLHKQDIDRCLCCGGHSKVKRKQAELACDSFTLVFNAV